MKLKDFVEASIKKSPMNSMQLIGKLIELQAIEQYINLMFGVELDINVKPAPRRAGRFFGDATINRMFK